MLRAAAAAATLLLVLGCDGQSPGGSDVFDLRALDGAALPQVVATDGACSVRVVAGTLELAVDGAFGLRAEHRTSCDGSGTVLRSFRYFTGTWSEGAGRTLTFNVQATGQTGLVFTGRLEGGDEAAATSAVVAVPDIGPGPTPPMDARFERR